MGKSGCLSVILALAVMAASICIAVLSCGQLLGGRVNVLVLGLDRREGEEGPCRADTILLATFAPREGRIGLLSIPRDLWVEIPGHGQGRINTAHFLGECDRPGGGPELAKRAVAHNFGVPVHRYIRLDFEGFKALVDALGGIAVDVEEAIADDRYPTEDYGYTSIYIPAGRQHMDGEMALRYVRTRHGSSDFDRIRRQQKVVVAMAERLLNPAIVLRLPAVVEAAKRAFDTDMPAHEILILAPLVLRVGPEGIERRAIDESMARPHITDEGANVLLPDWEAINRVVRELFGP